MAGNKKKKHPLHHLVAGGCAGLVESSVCHPLDTIKTRMQLRRNKGATASEVVVRVRNSLMEPALRLRHSLQEPLVTAPTAGGGAPTSTTLHVHDAAMRLGANKNNNATVVTKPGPGVVQAPLGPIGTARRIVQREGFLSLYKGLTAVWTGIVPKMAVRFVAFEQYREWGTAWNTSNGDAYFSPTAITFTAGLFSGLTEAILVVTPAEVCKIRMQSQYHSMMDPAQMQKRKYTNVVQTAGLIVKEEGLGALYKGVVPTMLRQGCNQAANFTAYNLIKKQVCEWQHSQDLLHWQALLIGGVSGGLGPICNNPLDVVKTRLQKQVVHPGKTPKYTGLLQACTVISREEGIASLWKGITPRLMRICPGQAITFMTYEAVSQQITRLNWF